MTFIETILLSIIEGLTEFLPISSTGHLILASHLLQISQTEFTKSFEIAIQLGAILAIVTLYWRLLLEKRELWITIVAAFTPTALVGFLLYPFIKAVLLENTTVTLLALFIGGIVLIVLEKRHKEESEHTVALEKISIAQAAAIGCAQSLSIIPGVSRAAATIFGGIFSGLSRKASVEFSFLLAIPTMAAATGLDLLKSGVAFTGKEWLMLGAGFLGAFFTALLAVKYFLKYIQNHTFAAFGVYRIALALLFWLFVNR